MTNKTQALEKQNVHLSYLAWESVYIIYLYTLCTQVGEKMFIDGIMNASGYTKILASSLQKLCRRGIFQQVNDLKHGVKNHVCVSNEGNMAWLCRSSDMNPTECLKNKGRETQPLQQRAA